jgi:DinB superfamily
MAKSMRYLMILSLAAVPLHAQAKPATNAATPGSFAVAGMREGWQEFASFVEQSAADMPAEKYGFTPVAGSRTFGQIIAHVAGSSYTLCAAVLGDPARDEDEIEKTNTTKAQLTAVLKESTAYCAKAFAITDEAAHGIITVFGGKHDKLWALMVTTTHDAEQYGNLLPYLRMNGLIPPSSKPSSH